MPKPPSYASVRLLAVLLVCALAPSAQSLGRAHAQVTDVDAGTRTAGAEGPARTPVLDPPVLSSPIDIGLESTRVPRREVREARGRVVIVFYEDRGHLSDNHELKLLLYRFIQDNHLESATTTYGVANILGLPEVMRGMARSAISSMAEGWNIEILLDWDGAFTRAPASFPSDQATVALLDRQGRLRFRASGALDAGARTQLFRALRRLLREPTTSAVTP